MPKIGRFVKAPSWWFRNPGDHQLLKDEILETWDILNINWLVGDFFQSIKQNPLGLGLVHEDTQLFSAIYRGPTTPLLGPPIYTQYCWWFRNPAPPLDVQKPSKRCSKISISTGEWIPDFWLPSNQTVSRYTNDTQWSSSSGQSSWGQWNLASSYLWRGEGVGQQKKNTPGLVAPLDRWTVVIFFFSDPENGGDVVSGFWSRPKLKFSPEAYEFFIYIWLKEMNKILGVVYLLASSLFSTLRIRFPPQEWRHFEDPENTPKNRVIHPKPWRRFQPGDSLGKRNDCQVFLGGSYCHADRIWYLSHSVTNPFIFLNN